MRDHTTGLLGSILQKRTLKRWERLADFAHSADIANLRELRRSTRALAQRVSVVNHITEARLARPMIGSNAMDLPPATDWSYRPEIWSGPISPIGYAPARNNTKIGSEVTLFHDCTTQMLTLRQMRNQNPSDLAPFGLQMDVFTFDGSFLSLVVKAPDTVIKGLGKKHVLRITIRANTERPLKMSARLNLKHGPNTEQVNRDFRNSRDVSTAEFDMAYVPFNENRIEHVWFDIFLDSPSMNQVTLRDLTLSRHARSNL